MSIAAPPTRDAERLRGELTLARAGTDALFARVPPALMFERTIAERHRLAFYLGHLEAFDINLLMPPGARDRAGSEAFHHLFAFGIDPLGESLPSDRIEDWPALDGIAAYAGEARAALDQWLDDPPEHLDGIDFDTLLHTALEHRWMHAETLAYLIHRLPLDKRLRPAPPARDLTHLRDMVDVPGGRVTLGREADGAYGWDNEFGAQTLRVDPFRIDRYQVSNGQFLQFLEAGGYREPRWWTEAGWAWRTRQGIEAPSAWQAHQGDWTQLSVGDRVAFRADWPVFVSHAEASAYARWAGKTLPTEAQWQRAAYGTLRGGPRYYPWGDAAPTDLHGNFDFQQWDPSPVDAHPAGASAFGVVGLLGNAWEWTRTEFGPLPGFAPSPYYRGYSADFFDGQHFVLKGGSAHTAARLLRPTFRNWFQAFYPFPFAGFRCVSTP